MWSDSKLLTLAVKRIWNELPSLFGTEAWNTLQGEIEALVEVLESQPDDTQTYDDLLNLFWDSESANRRLHDELDDLEQVATCLSEGAASLESAAIDQLVELFSATMRWDVQPKSPRKSKSRVMSIGDGGAAGAKSIKLKNLDLDLGKMMAVGGGFFLAGQEALEKLTPFAVAGGILAMVGALLSEMTVKIEQQEATVFWGFIVATNDRPKDRQATADLTLSTTNAERRKRGLPELTDEQFKHSFYKLEQLGSVERVEGDIYRIVERFKVKG